MREEWYRTWSSVREGNPPHQLSLVLLRALKCLTLRDEVDPLEYPIRRRRRI